MKPPSLIRLDSRGSRTIHVPATVEDILSQPCVVEALERAGRSGYDRGYDDALMDVRHAVDHLDTP